MATNDGGHDDEDPDWRRAWHQWLRDLQHHYAYLHDGAGGYSRICSLPLGREEHEKFFAEIQKRLVAEKDRPVTEPGYLMHPYGCPIRYPSRLPPEIWVRPFISRGRRNHEGIRARPFFRNQRSEHLTPGERKAAWTAGERLAAMEEIFAGAEAAGWDFWASSVRQGGFGDVMCQARVGDVKALVAFRLQLSHRNLGEFMEEAERARANGVHLIWLMAERDGKDVATLPYRPPEVPVVRLQILHRGFHADAYTATQGDEDGELFRVHVLSRGQPVQRTHPAKAAVVAGWGFGDAHRF